MRRFRILGAIGAAAFASTAQAQISVDDQPITNLQNGISPRVASVRREQDDRAIALARLNKSVADQAIAVRGRLAEHDCQGARNIAAQGYDPTLSADIETLCAPAAIANDASRSRLDPP